LKFQNVNILFKIDSSERGQTEQLNGSYME